MKVQDLMTREVHSCWPVDRLEDAARILWENDCGIAPVVDEFRKLVGVITDRDICMAAYTRGAALRDLTVASAMALNVQCCKPDDSLERAERTMQTHRLRRLPVVDDEGRVVGLLSISDIARTWARSGRFHTAAICAEEVADTLAAVGQRRNSEVANEPLPQALAYAEDVVPRKRGMSQTHRV